ncbi:MAG: LLM class flavin-dependent oxidoreductase [Chloroflexi bacterium]|nr:LLM class flavin-dependent oxidoreductase [Chloroflexota bacterium]MDA1217825.1 LLM class flavin-dependent oxidoreductase [Chloroflexota bacterium]
MAIQIDLRVPPCAPVPEVGKFAALCETAGFDGVGILDSQMLERDVFVSMAAAAQATSSIRVSSAVLNPVTRHLSVIASAMKTVAELAPGRAEFWIGRGFSSVQTVGIPPATVRQMRDGVLTLRSLLSGQNMAFGVATSRMRHGDAQVPRIIIAAHGPRTIEVAGEVADGVLLQVGLHPGSVALARQHLEAGAKRAGRDPDELEIILCATTIIMDDQQEAREVARPLCVQRLVEQSHAPYLQASGIDTADLEIPVKELSELYPDIPHAEDWERAKQLCAFLPDDILAKMCDAIGLIGTPEYCAQRIRQAEANGIGHLYLMTSESYQFPHRELAAFRDQIFPALRSA